MAGPKFNRYDPFKKQEDAINSMSPYNNDDDYTKTTTMVRKAVEETKNPFGLNHKEIPKDKQAVVCYHGVTADPHASEEEAKPLGKGTVMSQAVITRILEASRDSRVEEMQLQCLNPWDQSQATTMTIRFGKDGKPLPLLFTPLPIEKFTEGLKTGEKTNEGANVQVVDTTLSVDQREKAAVYTTLRF